MTNLLIAIAITLSLSYIAAVAISNRRFREWPIYRIACWLTGIGIATVTVVGPLTHRSHSSFEAHMTGHLLLGMLAPLFLALSSPVTLILRTLKTSMARRFVRFMHFPFIQLGLHPIVASLLNIGGLWLLYASRLYEAMHGSATVYAMVHLHLFLSGYLFTSSIVYLDPVSTRYTFKYRAIILVLATAGHSLLAKWIYVSPPVGVPMESAEAAAQIMYYGGDFIESLLIVLFCMQWFSSRFVSRSYREGGDQGSGGSYGGQHVE